MPRPTHAQIGYGSATVVLSTLAILLLADVRSAGVVVAVAAVGLVLGLAVAASLRPSVRAGSVPVVGRTAAAPVPQARVGGAVRGAEARVGQHSLR